MDICELIWDLDYYVYRCVSLFLSSEELTCGSTVRSLGITIIKTRIRIMKCILNVLLLFSEKSHVTIYSLEYWETVFGVWNIEY